MSFAIAGVYQSSRPVPTELVELALADVQILLQLKPLYISSLKRLHLACTTLDLLGVLSQHAFPHLDTLALVLNVESRDDATQAVWTFKDRVGKVAPQLRRFTISVSANSSRDMLSRVPTTLWQSFQSLQSVVLDFDGEWFPPHFPLPLQHLRLRLVSARFCSLKALTKLLEDDPPSLVGLQTLTIPSDLPRTTTTSSGRISRRNAEEDSKQEQAERTSLRVLCQTCGIELFEKKNFDNGVALASLGDAMGVW